MEEALYPLNEEEKTGETMKTIIELKTPPLPVDYPLENEDSKSTEDRESFNKDNTNLRWVRWNGSLPQGAISFPNPKCSRVDYVSKFMNNAGFYTPSKGSHCYYSMSDKEERSDTFDILVNKDYFEPLVWKSGRFGSVPANSVKSCALAGVLVGRTSHGLGKVVPQHKACFCPYEGKEYCHNFYDVLTISEENYFQQIFDIIYKTEQQTVVRQSNKILGNTTIDNLHDHCVQTSLQIHICFAMEKCWDIGRSTAAGVKTQITAPVPHFDKKHITLGAKKTFQCNKGTMLSEEKTHEMHQTLNINIPARSKCTVQIQGEIINACLPFTAKLKRKYKSGPRQTSIEGVFKTASYEGFKAIVGQFQSTET